MNRISALFLAALFCALAAVAQQPAPPAPSAGAHQHAEGSAPDELVLDGKVVGKKVPAKPGDICMLCNNPVDSNDTVYLVNGQRVPLHNAERAAASTDSLRALVAQLRPRGAFLGADSSQPQASQAWFYFGLYVLVGLIFAALCAHRALISGYSPIQWLLAGLAFNVLAYAALLTRPKREVTAPAGIPAGLRKISSTYLPEACPACGTENHPSAADCSGCGAKLTPTKVSEVTRAGLAH